MKEKCKKLEKGITLIALVVTIVVLLILAGTSIAMLAGENGIIKKAVKAKQENDAEGVKEEVDLGITSIKSAALIEGYTLTLEDITNEESKYALEKEVEIEWIDKNSNPVLLKKDNFYCWIYDDLSLELSETIETYSINANLENYTMSNKNKRALKDKKYQTQIIPNEYYSIESIAIFIGENDVTDDVYNTETQVINIDKLTDNLTITVVTKVQLNANEVVNNTELLTKLLDNENTRDYILKDTEMLSKLISNATSFQILANDESTFADLCENSTARLYMYNNYTVTQSIIANSPTAISAMRNSSMYEVVSAYGGSNRVGTVLYGSKAFVISGSQNTFSNDSYADSNPIWNKQCCHFGNFLSSSNIANNHYTSASTYGSDGLRYNICMFASSVVGAGYNHYNGGGPNMQFYAAIFKI